MAHTFDSSVDTAVNSNTSISVSYNCGSGATLLVLGIMSRTDARGGSLPTYGGISFSGPVGRIYDSDETVNEMYYFINPSAGIYNIVYDNPNARAQTMKACSFKAASGYTSAFDTSAFGGSTIAQTNPSTNAPCINGGVTIQFGANGAGSIAADQITAATHTIVRPRTQSGQTAWLQYILPDFTGDISMGFITTSNEDWGAVVGTFKEVPIGGGSSTIWGGILKYYNGSSWTECPSSYFKVYLNSNWTICPSQNFKIYRPDFDPSGWYPVRFQG